MTSASDSPHVVLADDAVLGPVVAEFGPVALEPADDLYARLVVSLVRQQVSMDAAAAIRERLFDRFTVTPAAMLAADPGELREVGLSAAKVEYVKTTARAFQDRDYDPRTFEGMDDATVVEELTDIRGIGPWTGKMFLIFCLGREDVFPVEDLGIRNAMVELFDADLSRAEMVEEAARWGPYRSYASRYLWRYVES